MKTYKAGMKIDAGQIVGVDEKDGLLYPVQESEYDAAIRTGKSACANGEPPKRKSFREFFKENHPECNDKLGVSGEQIHLATARLFETVADYMDYISGSEVEAESSSFCLACGKFFNDVVSKVCPGCGSGHFTDLSEPEAKPPTVGDCIAHRTSKETDDKPKLCAFTFKSKECGYNGSAGVCDGTKATCDAMGWGAEWTPRIFEGEPEPPTTEDHAETCVDTDCKVCGKPQIKTCLQCKRFVEAKDTGFHAMGCQGDGIIMPTTAEIENPRCFEAKP